MKTKMKLIASIKIWIVLYPSILLFFYMFEGFLSTLPHYQSILFLTLILVPWIVFIGVPIVDFMLRFFSSDAKK